MTAPTPEGIEAATVDETPPPPLALSDADVQRIAAATVTMLLDTKIKTTDAPDGRYLRTVLSGLFNGTQRIIKRVGA